MKMSDIKITSTLESRMTLHFISFDTPATVLFGIFGTAAYPDTKGNNLHKRAFPTLMEIAKEMEMKTLT